MLLLHSIINIFNKKNIVSHKNLKSVPIIAKINVKNNQV